MYNARRACTSVVSKRGRACACTCAWRNGEGAHATLNASMPSYPHAMPCHPIHQPLARSHLETLPPPGRPSPTAHMNKHLSLSLSVHRPARCDAMRCDVFWNRAETVIVIPDAEGAAGGAVAGGGPQVPWRSTRWGSEQGSWTGWVWLWLGWCAGRVLGDDINQGALILGRRRGVVVVRCRASRPSQPTATGLRNTNNVKRTLRRNAHTRPRGQGANMRVGVVTACRASVSGQGATGMPHTSLQVSLLHDGQSLGICNPWVCEARWVSRRGKIRRCDETLPQPLLEQDSQSGE